MKNYIVLTSINPVTPSVEAFRRLRKGQVILVGDRKSRPVSNSPGLVSLDIQAQEKEGFRIFGKLPFNHYSRKNIGYLRAMREGAELIYETDDDNAPLDGWDWPGFGSGSELYSESGLVNVFRWFSSDHCWPRGFPLERVNDPVTWGEKRNHQANIGVWQGMVDGSPDVDAIFRLTVSESPKFHSREPFHLAEGVFSPFNSQNTFWSKQAFPLMYLPAFVSFRFTDILRGYVAQRIMWDYGLRLGFLPPNVFQERNEHDLMADFRDEISVYTGIEKLIRILRECDVETPITAGLFSIYKTLHREGLVVRDELDLLELWCADVNEVAGKGIDG